MKVSDWMTRDPATCRSEENLAEVAERMWDRDCGIVPVVDRRGEVIGMVTDRDLAIAAATHESPLSRIGVRQMVPRPVFTCLPEDDVSSALAVMRERRVRRLPVVGMDGTLAGILSLDDIAVHAEGVEDGTERRQLYVEIVETLRSVGETRRRPEAVPAARAAS